MAKIKLHKFCKLAKTMYTDLADIYREQTHINEFGATMQNYTPFKENIECRLSVVKFDPKIMTMETLSNQSEVSYKVFFNHSESIQKGDKIIVKRIQDDDSILSIYEGIVSTPLYYPSHLEAIMTDLIEA